MVTITHGQNIICRQSFEPSADEKEEEKDNYWMKLKMAVFLYPAQPSASIQYSVFYYKCTFVAKEKKASTRTGHCAAHQLVNKVI